MSCSATHPCAAQARLSVPGAARRPVAHVRRGTATSLRSYALAPAGAPRVQRAGLQYRGRSVRVLSAAESTESKAVVATDGVLTVELTTAEAKRSIKLDQLVKEGDQLIYVSAVGMQSTAEKAGVTPGQVLRAMSHPTATGEMWELTGEERLRYVRDGINLRRTNEVTLVFDKEPNVTAADAEEFAALAGQEEEEEEEEEELPPLQPMPQASSSEIRDREDLYTDNWDGDQYKGSGWNELTVGLGLLFLVPVLGLGFAAATYGSLWGTSSYAYLPF